MMPRWRRWARSARPFPSRMARATACASGLVLADSYHCSRYNTNTGRLTAAMFETVFATVRGTLDA